MIRMQSGRDLPPFFGKSNTLFKGSSAKLKANVIVSESGDKSQPNTLPLNKINEIRLWTKEVWNR